jgi:hypothetical protein
VIAPTTCAECGIDIVSASQPRAEGQRAHKGRGLCTACHHRHYRLGTLDKYPRATRSAADFEEDVAVLRAGGAHLCQYKRCPDLVPAAEWLGMSASTLARSLTRMAARQRAA